MAKISHNLLSFVREHLDRFVFLLYVFLLIMIGPQNFTAVQSHNDISKRSLVYLTLLFVIAAFVGTMYLLRKRELEERENPQKIRLINSLYSEDLYERISAAQRLGRVLDPCKNVIDALLTAYSSDENILVRQEANKSLNKIDGTILDKFHLEQSLKEAFSPLGINKKG